MKDYGNLWGEAFSGDLGETTENVVALLQAQCDILDQRTEGKVKAHFAVPKMPNIQALAQSVSTINMVAQLASNDSRTDANSLYAAKHYVFEICTNTYRFRLFDVDLQPLYPLTLVFDEGVYNEARPWPFGSAGRNDEASTIEVDDDDELMECFRIAANTKKVRYILKRLVESA